LGRREAPALFFLAAWVSLGCFLFVDSHGCRFATERYTLRQNHNRSTAVDGACSDRRNRDKFLDTANLSYVGEIVYSAMTDDVGRTI
jgi:hypothetical protein